MESKPELDKLMQGRLYEHSIAPPDFVWINIENELRRKRRRFVAMWWFLGLGLTATGLLALSVLNQQEAGSMQQAAFSRQQAAGSGQQEVESGKLKVESRQQSAGSGQQEVESGKLKVESRQQAAGSGQQEVEGGKLKVESRQQAIDLVVENNAIVVQNEDIPNTETQNFSSFAKLASGDANLNAWKRPSPEYPKLKPIVRKKETKNCYDFNHTGTVWWLDAYAGPSLTRRQFNAKDSEYDNYLQQRLETESPDMAFNAGVRASMLFRENFVVRSGLHYDQFVEKFEWADPNSIEVNIRTYTQLVNGVWETVIDTLSIEYGDNYIKTYNRFGMLDIPLEMGIELRRGRTGVSINGGVSLNLLFWKRGAILSPDNNQPAYFTPEEGTIDVFKTNAGLSIGGSVQWFYHIKPTIRLFAEPYYRQVLKPLTVDGHPVEQQYGIGGLKIGMTKILHGK